MQLLPSSVAFHFAVLFCQATIFSNNVVKRSSSKQLRIVGGITTRPHVAPWMVVLLEQAVVPFCGASLVNRVWIVTAAHCILSRKPEDVRAVAGEHDLLLDKNTRQERSVDILITNPNYVRDVGLVRVTKKFDYNTAVKPIDLPSANKIFTGTASVFGWGSQKNNRTTKTILNKLNVNILDKEKCASAFANLTLDMDAYICADSDKSWKAVCYGDSGGPLVQNKILIGVVSFGNKKCASGLYPTLFSQVSASVDWIRSAMHEYRAC